jgi:hypothetical protein
MPSRCCREHYLTFEHSSLSFSAVIEYQRLLLGEAPEERVICCPDPSRDVEGSNRLYRIKVLPNADADLVSRPIRSSVLKLNVGMAFQIRIAVRLDSVVMRWPPAMEVLFLRRIPREEMDAAMSDDSSSRCNLHSRCAATSDGETHFPR